MDKRDQIKALYEAWIKAWNAKNAEHMSDLLTADGNIIGFDGSQMSGPNEVKTVVGKIFADHPTAEYVTIVREIRFLSATVGLLRASVGMVPRGTSDINPAANAIQTLIAIEQQGVWRISLFQNTPAAFHGRPEAVGKLSEELRLQLKMKPKT